MIISYQAHSYASDKMEQHIGSNCIDQTVDISNLLENRLLVIPFFNNHTVWIYRRNNHQIIKADTSKSRTSDSIYASWWSQDKNPLDFNTSLLNTRSINNEYFVLYAYSPVGGYYLMYFSEEEDGSEKYDYLDNTWEGGFVDVVNKIAYDFTGRPIVINIPTTATKVVKELSKLSLMIPKYDINLKTKTVTLLCK